MSEMEVPEGWELKTLEDVCEKISDRDHTTPKYVPKGIPLVSPKNFRGDKINFINCKFISSKDHEKNRKKTDLKNDDILFSRIGTIGKVILNSYGGDFSILHSIVQIRANFNFILPKFLYYYLQSPFIQKRSFDDIQSVGTPDLGIGKIRNFPMIYPTDKKIQEKIIKKLDKIINEINEKNKIFENIFEIQKKQLEKIVEISKYHILKNAFRGNLTNEWRVKNDKKLYSSKITLDKFLEKRKQIWKSKYDSKKYVEPKKLSDIVLPDLPKNWIWATFDQVSERVTVGYVSSMTSEYVADGIPFLRSKNVRENKFDSQDMKFISKKFHEKLSKSSLDPQDLVVVRTGKVGTACIIPDTLPVSNCSDLIIVKQPTVIIPEFGAYYMNSNAKSSVKDSTVGAVLDHFNTKSMTQMPIPVPPILEQVEILKKINKKFSDLDKIESRLIDAQKYFERRTNYSKKLSQSIYGSAFSGKLLN